MTRLTDSLRGFGKNNAIRPLKRDMGRLQFAATTLGLGGQASLQWTPPDVAPITRRRYLETTSLATVGLSLGCATGSGLYA
jgi:hypothetical protein